MRRTRGFGALLLGSAIALATPHDARAFCGFYVGGAETKLFNNATMVVLMREGTRTVLSMQNNYQGPPADFAMVVPVPVVLQKENVKTLPREVFDHVDALAAPRLVEYWEQDPCPQVSDEEMKAEMAPGAPMPAAPAGAGPARDLGVRVEARFAVGEYEIVILSAQDALGLDTWLRQNQYKIPEGAEPVLRPYVQAGMKFFVAKVDAKKVRFDNGQAMLSPLRFHYDTETFSLPVRLGLLNSSGTQDLIVHILAKGKRYEVANYPNVTIPTNYDVVDGVRDQFGAFYAALFDRTLATSPGAVVTEYSWDASSCDPCPTPALEPDSIATLGADVLGKPQSFATPPQKPVLEGDLKIGDVTSGSKLDNAAAVVASYRRDYLSCFLHVMQEGTKVDVDVTAKVARDGSVREVKTAAPKGFSVQVQGCLADTWRKIRFDAPRGGSATVKVNLGFSTRFLPPPPPPPPVAMDPYGFVLTRLHARYTKDALGQDLVFREAPPIEGGREDFGAPKQKHGSTISSINNFQGRYIIRHPWTGPITCADPKRGVWGGPPRGVAGDPSPKPALKVAFAPRGQIELASLMREDVPELKIAASPAPSIAAVDPGARGCGSCGVQGSERALLPCSIAALLALLANERRRRRR